MTQDPVTTVATALRLVWVDKHDAAEAYVRKLSPDEQREAKTKLLRLALLVETVWFEQWLVAQAHLTPDALPECVGRSA